MKPIVTFTGANSNVYNLLGLCVEALRRAGQRAEADALKHRVLHECADYDAALAAMREACEVE